MFAAVRMRRDESPGVEAKLEYGIGAIRLSAGDTEDYVDATDGYGLGLLWPERSPMADSSLTRESRREQAHRHTKMLTGLAPDSVQ